MSFFFIEKQVSEHFIVPVRLELAESAHVWCEGDLQQLRVEVLINHNIDTVTGTGFV